MEENRIVVNDARSIITITEVHISKIASQADTLPEKEFTKHISKENGDRFCKYFRHLRV